MTKLQNKGTSYTLFAGYNMHDYRKSIDNKKDVIHFTDTDINRQYNTLDGRSKGNSQYAQLNVLNANNNRTLRASAMIVRDNSPGNYSTDILTYTGLPDGDKQTTSRSESSQRGIKYNTNFYGNFNLSETQFIETSVSADYTDNRYKYLYSENSVNMVNSNTREDLYNLNATINYGIRFKRGNSLTAKFMHFHKISMQNYTGNQWQHLWTGETIAFAEYQHRFGQRTSLTVTPGISILQYRLHGNKKVSMNSPRLQTRITHQPGQGQFLMFGVSIGNSAPQMAYLSGTEQAVDFLHVKRGDPGMKDSKLYMTNAVYALNYKRISLQAVGVYLFADHVPTPYYFIENNKLLESYAGAKYHQIQGRISLTWRPNNKFSINTTGEYMDFHFNGKLSGKFSKSYWLASANASYFLKDFAFNAYFKKYTTVLNSDMSFIKMPVSYGLSASWSRNSWRIEAGTDNPFTNCAKYRNWYASNAYSYNTTSISKTSSRSAYIKLSYTIDFGKKTSKENADINKTIDSAILKAN
ncbi:hypothetical protein [Muribaculum caecicola]|uniref:Uncharacterized protein n=1 Tax=Muribaculum caecicola TaxID=3038144 RepID=A0AC61S7F0_9BACT|nr:hypothetical protein [Muribaculum caecicola]THG54272.1 hypothetical protein E5990_03400 [Muribaculum caecicola]